MTIWPKTVPSDFYHILSDPTPERLARMIHFGQQSAFPKVQFIKNRLNIENAIMRGLQQCSATGGRSLSPILSRRHAKPDQEDAMVERLDENYPERHDESRHDESRYADVSDNMSQSTTESRPQTPPSRRGRVMEEMRRQSAVFFDDTDLDGDYYSQSPEHPWRF